MNELVIGIDPSQTGLGIVAAPLLWGMDWNLVRAKSFGRQLGKNATRPELVELTASIARDVRNWVDWIRTAYGEPMKVCAFMEGFLSKGAFGHDRVIRVGSVVEHELRGLGIFCQPAPLASARKLFLGRCPPGAKKLVDQVLRAQTDVLADGDQRDAFVIMNWGMSELGGDCLAGARAA